MHRNAAAIDGQGEAIANESACFDLETFERAVHVTNGAARRAFLAKDMPRFQRGAEFHLNVALGKVADAREAELEVRREPVELERIPGIAQIVDDVLEIRLAEVRQHPAVVDVRAPADEVVRVGLLPEFGDESAQEQMLRETHARVRRHFEGAHLDETQATGAAVGRVELVDAELGAVGVAAGINEQIPEEPVGKPRRNRLAARETDLTIELLKGDFEFVEGVIASLIHARRLRGRADEKAAEDPAQRRMILPVGDERAEQIRTAQHGRIAGRVAANEDVVAAAGAGVASIHHELLGAEPCLAGFLVENGGAVHEFVPRLAGVQIDFDHAGVGRDFQHVETRITRWCVAFDGDGRSELGGGVFDGGDEFEIVFERRDGRHEDVELALARLDAERGADNPRGGLAAAREPGRIVAERFLLRVLIALATTT